MKASEQPAAAQRPVPEGPARRPVGRPRTLDAAQASLGQLLNLVRTGAAATRQELERATALGRAVVADRLAALVALGVVEEGDLGRATGGRAPRRMRFRARAGSLLVSVIDRGAIAVGIADLDGRLLVEHHEAADLAVGPEPVVDRLAALFRWMLEETEKAPPWAAGIALPGPVEKAPADFAAVPVLQTLPAWRGFPFVAEMTRRLGAPVWVRSAVQTMTIGELRAGSGRGAGDMIYVKLGRTISAGVISEGRLLRGADGAAGVIGHTRVGDDILEAVAGADAIGREGLAAAQAGASPYLARVLEREGAVSAVDVGHGAQLGDIWCVEHLGRCGRLIGEALAPVTNLLNPSLIVIGGVVAETGDSLLAGLREAVYGLSHPLVTRDLRILRSQMGASAGLVGAAQVAVEELFAPALLQGWITRGTPLAHPGFLAALEASAEDAAPGRVAQ